MPYAGFIAFLNGCGTLIPDLTALNVPSFTGVTLSDSGASPGSDDTINLADPSGALPSVTIFTLTIQGSGAPITLRVNDTFNDFTDTVNAVNGVATVSISRTDGVSEAYTVSVDAPNGASIIDLVVLVLPLS